MIVVCEQYNEWLTIELSPIVSRIIHTAAIIATARNTTEITVSYILEATKLVDPVLLHVCYPQINLVHIRGVDAFDCTIYDSEPSRIIVDLILYDLLAAASDTSLFDGYKYITVKHLLDAITAHAFGET